jgi:hypothetical protein
LPRKKLTHSGLQPGTCPRQRADNELPFTHDLWLDYYLITGRFGRCAPVV